MARLAQIIKNNKKPKFAVRHKNRCENCGRSKAFIGKFKLCRICFRTLSLKGMIPGVTKSSW
ncbi:MAG: type Z 30S ribosomal protein S14 [Bacteriovoracaceae bacterium]|jgi:small subunit ribosomal protein S14|nr:type Z 30S ribosomal protein S14 [Bacteriovoracaceae bacterium]